MKELGIRERDFDQVANSCDLLLEPAHSRVGAAYIRRYRWGLSNG